MVRIVTACVDHQLFGCCGFLLICQKKIETLLWSPKLLGVHILWRCLCVSSVKGPCFPPLVAHLLCVPGDDASSLASLDATPGRSATGMIWTFRDVGRDFAGGNGGSRKIRTVILQKNTPAIKSSVHMGYDSKN